MPEGVQFLWPTPLLRRVLPNHEAVNTALVEQFCADRDAHGGQAGTVYSSPDDLIQRLSSPALSELFAFVSKGVFEVAQAMNAPIWQASGAGKLQMHIVGAWYQIQNSYGFHDIHSHGNCSWSGVYYVQIDDLAARQAHPHIGATNGVTRFYGHQLGLLGGAHMDLGNAYLQRSHVDVVPEAGTLMVFPSWLNHKAMPYDGVRDRIIVSFNAQVHGERGDQAFGYGFH
jgi:Putative 2OG-Fe(II) oxygenase